MSLARELISKEILRLTRANAYSKKTIANSKFNGDKTGYRRAMELNEKSLESLKRDLKKI